MLETIEERQAYNSEFEHFERGAPGGDGGWLTPIRREAFDDSPSSDSDHAPRRVAVHQHSTPFPRCVRAPAGGGESPPSLGPVHLEFRGRGLQPAGVRERSLPRGTFHAEGHASRRADPEPAGRDRIGQGGAGAVPGSDRRDPDPGFPGPEHGIPVGRRVHPIPRGWSFPG